MPSKPPPGAPPPAQPMSAPAARASSPAFKLGIGPILAVATVALLAGILIGKHGSGSNGSLAGAPASQPAQTPPAAQSDTATLEGKASDTNAKVDVITAAQAMEVCATDHGGSYEQCSSNDVVEAKPSLAQTGDRLTTSVAPATYKVSVRSANTSNEFRLERRSNGMTARSCDQAGTLGCPPGGIW